MFEFEAATLHWQTKVLYHRGELAAQSFDNGQQSQPIDSAYRGSLLSLWTECQRRSLTSIGLQMNTFPTMMIILYVAASFWAFAKLGFNRAWHWQIVVYMATEFNERHLAEFIPLDFFPLARDMRSHLLGCRVGEALHPGPPGTPTSPSQQHKCTTLRITTLNPTAILDKEHILQGLASDLYFLSETSATGFVQRLMTSKLRRIGYKSIWGTPARAHRFIPRGEGVEDRRGLATGVSIHATLPLQASNVQNTQEWEAAGRLTRGFVKLGTLEIQCIAIYGVASSNQQARQKTDALLKEAASLAMETEMPTIIAGDLNHSPDTLTTWQILQAHGWRHTAAIHEELYACPIPCTYLQASTPDMMMFSPHLSHLVQKIEVDQTGWVAGHHPLTATLQIPQQPPTKTTWRLPQSWIPYAPTSELIGLCYERAPPDQRLLQNADSGPTLALKEWASQIEQAVDGAIYLQHLREPELQPYDCLPFAAKGRCRIPKLIQAPQQRSIKKAWHGHYNPEVNTGPIKLRQRVRQIRRLQSLRLRLQKLEHVDVWTITWLQLWEEWRAILRAAGFSGGFEVWLALHPELPDSGEGFPSVAGLFDMEQLLRYETKILESQVAHQQRALKQFHRWFDKKRNHSKNAFATMKEESFGCLQTTQIQVSSQATFERNDALGLLTLQLGSTLPLRPDLPVWLDQQMATVIHYEHPQLEVMLNEVENPVNNPCQVSQQNLSAEPEIVGQALTAYWNRYWQRDLPQEQADLRPWQAFENILASIPDLPPLEIDLTDRELWRDAIKALKSTTARGVCGFFADELKQISKIDAILDDLITICMNLTAFPSWFMISKVFPVSKCYNASSAAQVRPITVLALIYRVWGRATSHSLMRSWASTFPAAVSGFLPGRSAEALLFHWQHKLERIHSDATEGSLGGFDTGPGEMLQSAA